VETGCRIGNVQKKKNVRDRSSLRLANEVRFDANNVLEYDIPLENWKVMWMAMASSLQALGSVLV